MLDTLLTFPAGFFFLLWGILWNPQPKREDDDLAEFLDEADTETPRPLTQKEMRKYLRLVALRVGIFVLGMVGVVSGIIDGLGAVNDGAPYALFVALYAGGLLALQRTMPSQRLIVLLIIGFIGLLVWRYAIFREYRGEHNWGLITGLAFNFGFYVLLGRHMPPQDRIEVITE